MSSLLTAGVVLGVITIGLSVVTLMLIGVNRRLRRELAVREQELSRMEREYDEEHHGMGVKGSDFDRYGGSYHRPDGTPYE